MAASKDKARAILSYATPNPVGPYRLVTPPTPDLGAGKTKTPVMPVMGGPLVNLPTPVKPTKQTTPVAPPMADKLVNVPKQQGRVVNKITQEEAKRIMELEPREFTLTGQQADALVDLYENIKDPKVKARYEELLERKRLEHKIRFGPKTIDQGESKDDAVRELNRTYAPLLRAGFRPETITEVHPRTWMWADDLVELSEKKEVAAFKALDADRQITLSYLSSFWEVTLGELVDAVNSLNKKEQETARVLTSDWSGTLEEMLDAARSLSR